MGVDFFSEELDFNLKNETYYSAWVEKIATYHDSSIKQINYIFCSDSYLLKINQEYLNHDYYTDIISFPYAEVPNPIEGDIFISIDRIKESAKTNQVTFENELHRVMAHGILHFLGFKDKSPEEIEIMRRKEEEMMQLFSEE